MVKGDRHSIDDRRRELLRNSVALGWLATVSGWSPATFAEMVRRAPIELPPGRNIYQLRGEVLINGRRANIDSAIKPGDTIRTGSNSLLIARVGSHALLVRENSTLEVRGTTTLESLRIATGRVLGLFARKTRGEPIRVRTPTVTIGIRGTAIYTEAYADRSYVCTCYGSTILTSEKDPAASEAIVSKHHDAPRWILAEPEKGRLILPAPVINHKDEELALLESLTGREHAPYGEEEGSERPRREY
jgi:hypothetical protein